VHKLQIFPAGFDPRKDPDIIDLRSAKKAPSKSTAE